VLQQKKKKEKKMEQRRKAREAAKSATVLFHEAMEQLIRHEKTMENQLEQFEKAADKGHEAALWMRSILNGVEKEQSVVKEAFAKSEEPLGWYFAGELCWGNELEEQVALFKKSAEGGCSWAIIALELQRKSTDWHEGPSYQESVKEAIDLRNPKAMRMRGSDQLYAKMYEEAHKDYLASAKLGWRAAMDGLMMVHRDGLLGDVDFAQALWWCGRAKKEYNFNQLVERIRSAYLKGQIDADKKNEVFCRLGEAMYWQFERPLAYKGRFLEENALMAKCLEFYLECVDLECRSIYTFLLCWNLLTRGVKGPGQIIAKMVYEMVWDKVEMFCEFELVWEKK
jgi:hypothetical protein